MVVRHTVVGVGDLGIENKEVAVSTADMLLSLADMVVGRTAAVVVAEKTFDAPELAAVGKQMTGVCAVVAMPSKTGETKRRPLKSRKDFGGVAVEQDCTMPEAEDAVGDC